MMIVIAVGMTATMMAMVEDAAGVVRADEAEADECTGGKSAASVSRKLT